MVNVATATLFMLLHLVYINITKHKYCIYINKIVMVFWCCLLSAILAVSLTVNALYFLDLIKREK